MKTKFLHLPYVTLRSAPCLFHKYFKCFIIRRTLNCSLHLFEGTTMRQALLYKLKGKKATWFARRSLLNSVNNYQMPDFHNLNLPYQIERQSIDKTIVWNFSVYNVHNRLNPWYYYKKGDKLKQITLFPIIPSVSFIYKW